MTGDTESSAAPGQLSPTSDPHVEDVQKEHFSTRIDKVSDYYSAQSEPWLRGASRVNTRIKTNNLLSSVFFLLHMHICQRHKQLFQRLWRLSNNKSSCHVSYVGSFLPLQMEVRVLLPAEISLLVSASQAADWFLLQQSERQKNSWELFLNEWICIEGFFFRIIGG